MVPSIKPLPVTTFFDRLGDRFVRGHLREITEDFSYPCPLEFDGHLVVMRGPDELEAAFVERRAAAMADGLRTMTPRILAIEMPRGGRFRVWLRWEYQFPTICIPDEAASVYFMAQRSSGALSIEMMDLAQAQVASPRALIA